MKGQMNTMSTLINSLSAEPEKVLVESSKGNALLVFDIDEDTITLLQAHELIGVHIAVYTKVNDDYIKVLTKNYVWKGKEDRALTIYGLPTTCYLEFAPILDTRIAPIFDDDGEITGYDIIPEQYVRMDNVERALAKQHLADTFPVSVDCTVDVLPSGGHTDAEIEDLAEGVLDKEDVLSYDE